MKRMKKSRAGLVRGIALTLVVAAISLTTFGEADAHRCRRRVVVWHAPRVVVRHYYGPTVVKYVPAEHVGCVIRSGYYYSPVFGYHYHRYHPGGIYFGVHFVL